jgi:hypothetical protein
MASPASVGRSGQDRLGLPFNVYVLKPGDDEPSLVLGGVLRPGPLTWAPDTTRLLFPGNYGGVDGLWLLDPTDGSVALVTAGTFYSAVWSPGNDDVLMALRDTGEVRDGFPLTEIVRIELPARTAAAPTAIRPATKTATDAP